MLVRTHILCTASQFCLPHMLQAQEGLPTGREYTVPFWDEFLKHPTVGLLEVWEFTRLGGPEICHRDTSAQAHNPELPNARKLS